MSDLVVGTVTIEHVLTDDDSTLHVYAEAGDGEPLGLVESLGMLRLAEVVLLEEAGDDDD